MNAGSRSEPDDKLQPFLRLERAEGWFAGTGVAAILVGGTAATVALNSVDPARTIAELVIVLAFCVLVFAVVGYIVTNVREGRALERAVPFADVSALMDKHRWDEAIVKLEVAQGLPIRPTRSRHGTC